MKYSRINFKVYGLPVIENGIDISVHDTSNVFTFIWKITLIYGEKAVKNTLYLNTLY